MPTYYVDGDNGADGNSGLTEVLAKATIGAAVALAVSGDVIYVQTKGDTVYNEMVTVVDMSLTFIGYGPNDGDLTRPLMPTINNAGGSINCFRLSKTVANNNIYKVIIRNFHMTQGTGSGVYVHRTGGTGDLVPVIINCHIFNNDRFGVEIDSIPVARGVYVNRCFLHDNDEGGILTEATATGTTFVNSTSIMVNGRISTATGEAVWCEGPATFSIVNCVIAANGDLGSSAVYHLRGGGHVAFTTIDGMLASSTIDNSIGIYNDVVNDITFCLGVGFANLTDAVNHSSFACSAEIEGSGFHNITKGNWPYEELVTPRVGLKYNNCIIDTDPAKTDPRFIRPYSMLDIKEPNDLNYGLLKGSPWLAVDCPISCREEYMQQTTRQRGRKVANASYIRYSDCLSRYSVGGRQGAVDLEDTVQSETVEELRDRLNAINQSLRRAQGQTGQALSQSRVYQEQGHLPAAMQRELEGLTENVREYMEEARRMLARPTWPQIRISASTCPEILGIYVDKDDTSGHCVLYLYTQSGDRYLAGADAWPNFRVNDIVEITNATDPLNNGFYMVAGITALGGLQMQPTMLGADLITTPYDQTMKVILRKSFLGTDSSPYIGAPL